jgi:hypothetical protein
MVIKSTVLPDQKHIKDDSERRPVDLEELKASILSECRQVVLDTLREQRER